MRPPPKGPAQMTGRLVGRAVESTRHTEGMEMGRYNQGVPPHPRDQRGDRHVWPIQVTGSETTPNLWPAKIRYWQSYSDPTHTFADWAGGEGVVWAITVPGGDELTNTQQYLAVFVGVHTDGKAVFEVVGGGATSPPPSPPPVPLATRTVVGTVDVNAQELAGRKHLFPAVAEGSGGVASAILPTATLADAGVWVGGRATVLPGGDLLAPLFVPHLWGAEATAEDEEEEVPATEPMGAMVGLVGISSTFYVLELTTLAQSGGTVDPQDAAGRMTLWDQTVTAGSMLRTGNTTTAFGVVRDVLGEPAIDIGIDGSGSACVITEIVGGIVVGTTTPDTASPADSDYFIFCASGVAKKVTLANLAARVAEINASVPPPPP